MIDSNWKIDINNEQVTFTRIHNGKIVESYAPVNKDKASVFAVAIIQCFEPPRCLLDLEK